MFIKTISPEEAMGENAALYEAEKKSLGRVMQATQCWSARPDVIVPVEKLLNQLRDGFSLGLVNVRLITFVAARSVPSAYCSHVYFRSLTQLLGRGQALAVMKDYKTAGLSEQQVEMLGYAKQISRDASQITRDHIQRLRDVGLSDGNIADVALAASYRNFMSRYFDAVGATVEPESLDEDPAVRTELAAGER
jgi:Uncharacterized protein conserved in bacteria